MKEIWKDIPGYEGTYQASSLGRIRSLPRVIDGGLGRVTHRKGCVLRPATERLGYLRLSLKNEGTARSWLVHRLIAITFLGQPMVDRKEINHKDSDKKNNSIENLEWCSRSYNIKHSFDNGTQGGRGFKLGEGHPHSKLTNSNIRSIRSLYNKKIIMIQDIARRFNIDRATVHAIA